MYEVMDHIWLSVSSSSGIYIIVYTSTNSTQYNALADTHNAELTCLINQMSSLRFPAIDSKKSIT